MGQVVAVIIIVLLVIFIFVPLSFLNSNNAEIRDIKQSLNLSAWALANCVSYEASNIENLANGYERSPEKCIAVDKDRLLSEFNGILYKNVCNDVKFEAVKGRLYIKVLVYQDMFYIADNKDRWSPPFFFTLQDEAHGLIYLSVNENTAYYYNGLIKTPVSLGDLGLDEKKRNEIIISSINDKVARFTYEINDRNSLRIQIQNPYINNSEAKVKMSYFNVLEGITFFVVYAEDTRITINSKDFHYKNYNVTGYTLEIG